MKIHNGPKSSPTLIEFHHNPGRKARRADARANRGKRDRVIRLPGLNGAAAGPGVFTRLSQWFWSLFRGVP